MSSWVDERKGANVAVRKGLEIMGTLGILDRAAERGLIDLAPAFDRLKATTFRYRQEMLDDLLSNHDRRGKA